MTGFKNFILRGNLVELAVALIMALAFTAIVTATVDLIMGLIGKVGGEPDFSAWTPGGLPVGAWITAVISFVVIATVVYFLIVMPYTKAKEMMRRDEGDEVSAAPEDVVLLTEIRDLLRERQGQV